MSTLSELLGGGGASVDLQEFTSSGTWTKPDGVTTVQVEVWGGGGGGEGGANDPSPTWPAGRAGGGGGYFTRTFKASDLGATVPVTVGAAGSAGTGRSTIPQTRVGGDGGHSYFGASEASIGWVWAGGGYGGDNQATQPPTEPGGGNGKGGAAGFYHTRLAIPTGQQVQNGIFGASGGPGLFPVNEGQGFYGMWSGGTGGAMGGEPSVNSLGSGSIYGGSGGGGGRKGGPSFDPGSAGGSPFTPLGHGGGGAGGSTRGGAGGRAAGGGGGGGGPSPYPGGAGGQGGAGGSGLIRVTSI